MTLTKAKKVDRRSAVDRKVRMKIYICIYICMCFDILDAALVSSRICLFNKSAYLDL